MELDELVVKVNILHQCIGDIKYSPEVEVAYDRVTVLLEGIVNKLKQRGLDYIIRELPERTESNTDKLRLCISDINNILKSIEYNINLKIAGEYLFKELNK